MSRPPQIRFLRFGGVFAIVVVVIVALVVALQVPTSVTYAKKVNNILSCVDRCDQRYGPAVEEACGDIQTALPDGSVIIIVGNNGPNCQTAQAALDACYKRCGVTSDPE